MLHKEKARRTRPVWFLAALYAFVLALPLLLAACSGQSAPASMSAQTDPTATTVVTGTASITATITVAAPITPTDVVTGTATPTEVVGTPTPVPTPTGPPPADPYAQLSVFSFMLSGNLVAKSDRLPLDGTDVQNVLLTITDANLGALHPVTEEVMSALGVLTWDPVYYKWGLSFSTSPISGTARIVPSINQFGGWNGGTLLGTSDRVVALRTSTLDGAAHLALYKWNKETHKADILRMVPVGGSEKDALFDADLDLNMADLNDDGIWEVIADNVAGVQIWRWDGSKYVPQEAR